MAIERATTNSSEHGDKKFTVAIWYHLFIFTPFRPAYNEFLDIS